MRPLEEVRLHDLDTQRDAAAAIEALFREARQRRRSRWVGGAIVAALLIASGGILLAVDGTGRGGPAPGQASSRPPSSARIVQPAESAPAGVGTVGRGPTAVDFTDPDHGWIASGGSVGFHRDNPTIVRTTDGGRNWERTQVPNLGAQSVAYGTRTAFGALVGIHFANPVRGWFFQAGIGWQTNDGGTSWTKMRFPVAGAVVALTSSGDDVWVLVDTCPIGAVSCPQSLAKGSLYHANSERTLSWRRMGGAIAGGIGALYPVADHSVVIALGPFNYRRSVGEGRGGTVATGCESVGSLRDGELAGVCGGGGGGDASTSSIAVSGTPGTTLHTLMDGPPSNLFIGSVTTNGADAIFYVTGGQTLWRTTTARPEWEPVLQVPTGSTDEIYPIYVNGSHGYALVSNGLDVHWFETDDAGASWEPVMLP
jgi:hypothetical protein